MDRKGDKGKKIDVTKLLTGKISREMYIQFLSPEFQESKNIESFQLWVNISVLQSINYSYNHKLRMPITVQWECRKNA